MFGSMVQRFLHRLINCFILIELVSLSVIVGSCGTYSRDKITLHELVGYEPEQGNLESLLLSCSGETRELTNEDNIESWEECLAALSFSDAKITLHRPKDIFAPGYAFVFGAIYKDMVIQVTVLKTDPVRGTTDFTISAADEVWDVTGKPSEEFVLIEYELEQDQE